METCLTKPIANGLSGCLVDNPECEHALRVGFSHWCRHQKHATFHGDITRDVPREELAKRYARLRQQRMGAFIAGLDEAAKEYFINHGEWHLNLIAATGCNSTDSVLQSSCD